ncbi:ABC transporter substrate-binding protein [Limobrevibacterium gyesilva]|uniref:Extracellular solute-binding protein n=1 Tax=Limobrevibacterium gyesilva TaxID=2991712 RepID=A0AA41YKB4_9PROT|nr:extracellular solute-binding protein [Limobrevibacterium gyesilva]MCW3475326.1 extracellular solute-binding protein [Limobrevibacterium gyesilva]
MNIITRRTALTAGAGALAAAALPGFQASAIPIANVEPPKLPIEKGATLRVLRPTKFVEPDEVIFRENVKKFVDATGVQTRVDFVGWEDLRPQTAVAANTGAGPDVVIGWPDDPHLYADKLLEVSDVTEYLGKKYGGWYFLAEKYGKKWGTNNWIAVPMGGSGGPIVYRKSWVKEAGFDQIPNDLGQFLKLCENLKKNNHPSGFALGNAVGDANAYCNWLLWAHGGYIVDEAGKIAINRKETVEALKYGKDLYKTFISGVLSWQDPSNNKAFIAEDIGLTANGVSIYFVLKNDPKTARIAEDTDHAPMPSGLVGKSPQSALVLNGMVFKHTKYPNASKEFLRFMMEQEQYEKWLTGCIGYWAQPLKAYAEADVWKNDPKIATFRDTCGNEFWNGYKGPITAASGAVTADYVNVQMFAAVSSGQATPEEAVKEAERRARRYYKS